MVNNKNLLKSYVMSIVMLFKVISDTAIYYAIDLIVIHW